MMLTEDGVRFSIFRRHGSGIEFIMTVFLQPNSVLASDTLTPTGHLLKLS